MTDISYEKLTDKIYVCVSDEHRFGADAFLLADFASPRKKDKVCDLGTGCGIIPLAMSRSAPPHLIYALDIQENAVKQLKMGLEHSETENKIIPIHADLKDLWEDAPLGMLDVVTCNPPYKKKKCGIQNETDAQKIARHEIMCDINDVCKAAAKLLRFGGRMCVCNRPERLCDVIEAMKNNGIEPKNLKFVSKNPHTPPWLFLIEGRKGGNSFLKVLPQMYVHNENGGYTEEMLRIYGKTTEVI